MAETWVLDPTAVDATRTQLDITSFIAAAGPDPGDAEIAAYLADQMIGSSPVDYRIPNRQIKIPLSLRTVGATSFATIRTQLQHKVALFQREGGTIMRQVGSTPLYADVVNATLHLGGSVFQAYLGFDVDAVLTLECIPDWYGAEVTLDTLTGTAYVASKLKSSSADAVIAGNHPGRVRVIVADTSGHDQKGVLWGWRCQNYGTATTEALAYQAEAMSPLNGAASGALTGASSGMAVTHDTLPADVWASVLYTNLISGSAALTHQGSYRVWARCYAGSALPAYRLQWGVGSLSVPVTNAAVKMPAGSAFYMVDLGSVHLDPPPTGTHKWYGVIQANVDNANDLVAIDQVFFQPLDDGAGRLAYTNVPPPSSVSAARNAGTAANVTGVGTLAWDTPLNVTVGGSWTGFGTASVGTFTSNWLVATGFGFAVPYGATILGVTVSLKKATSTGTGGYTTDALVALGNSGSQIGSGKSLTGAWANSPTVSVYGSPTDLWGATLTPTIVNSSTFGVRISATIANPTAGALVGNIYNPVTVTVFYTLAAGFTVAQDAVVFAGGTAELRTDGMMRAGTADGVYGPVSRVTGDLPRIPPSGLENRPVELFVKPSRGDLEQLPDSGLDTLSIVVKYQPSFLHVGA